jgi:hypothetical protein
MSASTLIVRITPGYDDKGNPDNLVAYNRGLSTLQLLELLVKQAKQGMPQANAGWRFDENPVAATGTFTVATGSGTLTAIINGVSIAITAVGTDATDAAAMATAINASTNALVQHFVTASSALGVVTVTAVESAVGLSGNAITTTATGTGFSAGQARLTGGTDGTAQVAAATATCAFTASSASGDLTAVIGGFTFIRAHATSDAADAAALASLVCEPSIRLPYSGQTGNFTAKLTVTGATSGATGVIAKDQDNGTSGWLDVQAVTGTFIAGEAITDSSTGAATIVGTGPIAGVYGKVTATDDGAGVMTVSARLPGTQGNAITTTAAGTGFTAAHATLTGGADPISTRFTF